MVMQGTGGNAYTPIAASPYGGFSWANLFGGMLEGAASPMGIMALATASEMVNPNDPNWGPGNAFAMNMANRKSGFSMLQQLLAGNDKVTIDSQKGTFNATGRTENMFEALGGSLGGSVGGSADKTNQLPGPGYGGQKPYTPPANTVTPKGPRGSVGLGTEYDLRSNPSSSPLGDLTFSDLAGLSPQEMIGFMNLHLAMETAEREDIVRRQNADTARINSLLQTSKFYNELSQQDRTAATKNYEYAVGQGYRGTFDEFHKESKTTHQKDYNSAVAGGYEGTFHEWMLEMAKTGAAQFNFGETAAKAKAGAEGRAEAERKTYFTSPGGLSKDLSKYMESEGVADTLFKMSLDNPNNIPMLKSRLAEQFIDGKIEAVGGKIVDKKLDGKTFVWTVQWPDGTTTEVRHAN